MIHTEVRPVGQDLKKVVLLDGLSSKIKCHGQKFQIVLLNGLFPQKAHFTPKTKESYVTRDCCNFFYPDSPQYLLFLDIIKTFFKNNLYILREK